MPITWEDFIEPLVDDRFLLPVEFSFSINYVQTNFTPSERLDAVSNYIKNCIVETVRSKPGCLLYEIVPRKTYPETTGEHISIVFLNPIYSFEVVVGSEKLVILKPRSHINDLIATLPLFEELASLMFTRGALSKRTGFDHPFSLIDIMGIDGIVHQVGFKFVHELRLGTHITQNRKQAKNIETLDKLAKISLNPKSFGNEHSSPFSKLQPEAITDGELLLNFTKTLSSRKRSLGIVYKGPYNVTQKDVALLYTYQTGEKDSEWQKEDLQDWKTPFVDFFRDMILNRFLPDLFYDIQIEPRIK